MALEWDVSEIKDYEKNFPPVKNAGGEEWNQVTDAIVWMGLFCGFSSITDKNLEKIAARIILFERMFKSLNVNPDFTDHPLTFEDVKKHVGLKVWGRQLKVKTDAEFCSSVGKRAFTQTLDKLRKDKNA